MPKEPPGPDVVVAGSARSGTSYLAATVGAHPEVDPCAVKEPEYFSRQFHRGADWYDGLFAPRRAGLLRLDASMSYTVPQCPQALPRLAAAAPHAFVVYAVRDPLPRAYSHYRLLSSYFGREQQPSFGQALRDNPVYLGAGDYSVWLPALYAHFPAERVLVVPFPVVTERLEVLRVLSDRLGIAAFAAADESAQAHRNEVVTFRHPAFRAARRLVRRSGAYPWLRRRVGPDRLRRWRVSLTREVPAPSTFDALSSCDSEQRAEIARVVTSSVRAASRYLRAQDERLGLSWMAAWQASLSDPATWSGEHPAGDRVGPAPDAHAR